MSRLADRLDTSVGPQHERERVARGTQRDAHAVGARSHAQIADRAEPVVDTLFDEGPVELPQQAARPALEAGQRAQRVPDQPHDGGGLGPLPADVADDRRPGPGAGFEDVVEVAPHLVAVPHREVPRGQVHMGDVRQVGRQQASLQHLGRAVPLLVEQGVVESRPRPPGDLLRQPNVGLAVPDVGVGGDEGQHPQGAAPRRQRNREERLHPEGPHRPVMVVVPGGFPQGSLRHRR